MPPKPSPPKRRPGRPRSSVLVSSVFRLRPETQRSLDRLAALLHGGNRTAAVDDAIRFRLTSIGLDPPEPGP
jgi:hypothetical protein